MRKILAALLLLATASVLVVPAAATQDEPPARASKTLDKATYVLAQDAPVAASDAAHRLSGRCFNLTARVLLDQLPSGRHGVGLACRPPAELTGRVGGSGRGVERALCATTDCPVTISYQKTPGHIVHWMYPVQTPDFYGFHCSKDLDEQPEGKPGVNGGPPGIFNGIGDMTHSPVISLLWCTGNGMIRPGSTVSCSGIATYPYFGRVTCSTSITPWYKPTRTVHAHFVFTGGSTTRDADLTATLVAAVPRDVLIIEWDWQL